MTARLHWAIKDTVDAYKGTQAELAELLGVNPNTFRNKVKPNKEEVPAHFTAAELFRLMQVTGDYRVMSILADEFGLEMSRRENDVATAEDVILHCLYCMQHGSASEADLRQMVLRCDLRRADVTTTIHTMIRNLVGLAEQLHG